MVIMKSILVTVATAGTPAQVTSDQSIRAHYVCFQVVAAGTQSMFVGNSAMNKTTLSGVFRQLLPGNTSGVIDSWEIGGDDQGNPFRLSDFYVDASANGGQLLVTYAN